MNKILEQIAKWKKEIEEITIQYGYKIISGGKFAGIETISCEILDPLLEAKNADDMVRRLRDNMFKKSNGTYSLKENGFNFSLQHAGQAYKEFEKAEKAFQKGKYNEGIKARDKGIKLKSEILIKKAKIDRWIKSGNAKLNKNKYNPDEVKDFLVKKYMELEKENPEYIGVHKAIMTEAKREFNMSEKSNSLEKAFPHKTILAEILMRKKKGEKG